MKRLRVTVEGRTYEVEVELIEDDESESFFPSTAITNPVIPQNNNLTVQPKAVQNPVQNTNINTNNSEVTAPMAGNITAINVKIGDSVKEGDKIAEMEAMKMITPLTALTSGKITEINVSVGDNINQGAIIAVIG